MRADRRANKQTKTDRPTHRHSDRNTSYPCGGDEVIKAVVMFSLRLRTVVLVTVDFVELLNKTSGDLSIAHGLKLTDVYNAATQDQDVFLEEYALY